MLRYNFLLNCTVTGLTINLATEIFLCNVVISSNYFQQQQQYTFAIKS